MLFIDDLLLSPFKGLFFIINEVHRAAVEALKENGKKVVEDLRNLHFNLEQGKITEAEFEEQETLLLDRLDAIQKELGEQSEEEDEE